MKFVFILVVSFFSIIAQARILSVTAEEVKVKFTASFKTSQAGDAYELISTHYQHLFGYFQSVDVVENFGLDRDMVLGAMAPKMPMTVEILENKKSNGERFITYKAEGRMIGHKKVVHKVLKTGQYEITMPFDLDNFYQEGCSTDPEYQSFDDFWYFYDPFQIGCGQLNEAPLAQDVVLKFYELPEVDEGISAGFDSLRGDNGNGELFEIYTMNGFSEGAKVRGDEGRMGYEKMNKWFRKQGFQETVLQDFDNRPVIRFEKEVVDKKGRPVQIRVTRLLAESSILSKNVTFAKFFKHAVENGDVVIYSGHSGLGGNLDIPSLEEKAGKFEFNPKKRQLFYFDGCSTYSYYLSPFEDMKSRSKIDILFHGLESLFASEQPVGEVLFTELFDMENDPTWMEVLKKMNEKLDGMSFLTGVGSL